MTLLGILTDSFTHKENKKPPVPSSRFPFEDIFINLSYHRNSTEEANLTTERKLNYKSTENNSLINRLLMKNSKIHTLFYTESHIKEVKSKENSKKPLIKHRINGDKKIKKLDIKILLRGKKLSVNTKLINHFDLKIKLFKNLTPYFHRQASFSKEKSKFKFIEYKGIFHKIPKKRKKIERTLADRREEKHIMSIPFSDIHLGTNKVTSKIPLRKEKLSDKKQYKNLPAFDVFPIKEIKTIFHNRRNFSKFDESELMYKRNILIKVENIDKSLAKTPAFKDYQYKIATGAERISNNAVKKKINFQESEGKENKSKIVMNAKETSKNSARRETNFQELLKFLFPLEKENNSKITISRKKIFNNTVNQKVDIQKQEHLLTSLEKGDNSKLCENKNLSVSRKKREKSRNFRTSTIRIEENFCHLKDKLQQKNIVQRKEKPNEEGKLTENLESKKAILNNINHLDNDKISTTLNNKSSIQTSINQNNQLQHENNPDENLNSYYTNIKNRNLISPSNIQTFSLNYSDRYLNLKLNLQGRIMNLQVLAQFSIYPELSSELASIIKSHGFIPGKLYIKSKKANHLLTLEPKDNLELKV